MNITEYNVEKRTLSSGITVLIEPLPWVRSVALGYYLRTGSAAESIDRRGATHFLEHLVFKGTPTRTTADIAKAIDALGGDVDAFTGKEYTSFHAHVLDEQLREAFDLLSDIVLRPVYSDNDFELERGVVLEEIRMVEDTPDDIVHELFIESFWPEHPLGRPILGTEDSVRSLSRSEIEDHYRSIFRPSNLMFCASGHVNVDEVIGWLEARFGDTADQFTHPGWPSPEPKQHVNLREKRELEQVHLCLGSRGIPQDSEDRYAAALFNTILGGGMSSRLFQRVREQEGLVYSVASYHNGHQRGGYEEIYAACSPSKYPRVLDLTLEELRKIRREGVTATELFDAKRHLKGSILLSLESTVSRMSAISRQEFYFGRQYTPDEIIAFIDAVTEEDVARIARLVLDPDTMSLTILGNVDDPGLNAEDLRQAIG